MFTLTILASDIHVPQEPLLPMTPYNDIDFSSPKRVNVIAYVKVPTHLTNPQPKKKPLGNPDVYRFDGRLNHQPGLLGAKPCIAPGEMAWWIMGQLCDYSMTPYRIDESWFPYDHYQQWVFLNLEHPLFCVAFNI